MTNRDAYAQGFDAALEMVRVGARYVGSGIAAHVADEAAKSRDEMADRFEANAEGQERET